MKLEGNIVTPQGVFYGSLTVSAQEIERIEEHSSINQSANWIFPGFIDLHVHGGGGRDLMEGEDALRCMLRQHLKTGTTSLLATTVTESPDELKKVFHSIAKVMQNQNTDESALLGVHLEGPFLSQEKIGAQPHFVRPLDLREIEQLHSIAPIRIITIAPEAGLDSKIITRLNAMGMVVQLGHSNCSYEESHQLLEHGIESVTHLFNAMSSMHHRAPGLVGATLAHAKQAEIIPDLLHVHPGAIKVALRAIPDLYFVTDATAATGMPDGDYKLGTYTVHKCANGVRLKDGTLAGSSLSMYQALINAKSLGLSNAELARRLATIQANLIKQNDRGTLEEGKRADLVVLSSTNQLTDIYLAGQKI